MKRTIIAVLMLIAVLSACSKRKGPALVHSVQQNNHLDTSVFMTAKINGEDWIADSVYAYRIPYTSDTGKMDLLVTASRSINDTITTITFTITDYTGINSYTISPPMVSATYYRGNERHYATGGSINISSDDAYGVIGTFNFSSDTIIISQGSFNVAKP